jgi:hypothetical protein
MSTTPHHLSFEALLDDWLGDADAAGTDAADEQLMRCDVCGASIARSLRTTISRWRASLRRLPA